MSECLETNTDSFYFPQIYSFKSRRSRRFFRLTKTLKTPSDALKLFQSFMC